jgi:hypothetical protein
MIAVDITIDRVTTSGNLSLSGMEKLKCIKSDILIYMPRYDKSYGPDSLRMVRCEERLRKVCAQS